MNILVIVIIFLVVVFLGYPFIWKQKGDQQSLELKEIDDYIEEQVRILRSPLRRPVEEARKRKIPSEKVGTTTREVVTPRGVFCSSCGAKILPDDRFCTSCGTKLKK
ncbi:MAG TPA: hypothetical protein DHV62_08580 [Elusimicrobia bacterium]|jgi:hypothetical protein|nr:hypothetical protein [Elusimicrobiota bacterium]